MRPIRLTALAAGLLTVTACGSDRPYGPPDSPGGSGSTGSAPSTRQPSGPNPPGDTPTSGPGGQDDGPTAGTPSPVTPRGGTARPRPVRFTGVKSGNDGRELKITWWSGVEPCHVLDRVGLAYRPDSVQVTLYEGQDPKRPNARCIEIAVRKSTVVTLKQPLGDREVTDGAR